MYCPHCGTELVKGALFCGNCGAKVESASNDGEKETFTQENPPQTEVGEKSRIAAGLLGIFLGVFGVHNFYLGFTGKAVAQLVLGICCAGTVSSIWGFIEGILILTGNINLDASGKRLRD